jgi:hypothetical protein
MNLLEPLKTALGWFRAAPAPALREAAGATIDADDDDWRRLTGDGNRDLTPLTQDRMQKIAHFLWESNLIANRLIELPVAYLLSDGVAWRAEDERANAALKRHWNDGLNAWDKKLHKRVRELALFGEQCYPVFRNESTGFVRLGYLDPALIETVVTDPENREQPIGIVTKRNSKGVARRYRVIVNVPESAFAERTQEIRATFDTGDCFYFRINDLASATRGRSDLLAQADWLDAYDQYLFGELDRASFLRAFVWDVTMANATSDEVKARAAEITAPKPNSVRVHNDAETWEPKAPELQAADVAAGARLFRNHVLGGATIPEHWYGGAEDVNRSTGESMAEPTEKMLKMRQQAVKWMLTEIAQYVVRSEWKRLEEELNDKEVDILDAIVIEFPELTAKDTTKYATSFMQVVSGCVQAIADGLLSRETALRVIAAVAARLGVEIDPEEELEKALSEKLDDSAFNDPPPPDDDVVPAGAPANADA